MTAKTPFVIASEARQSGFMGLLQDPPITKQFAQGLFMLPQVHFYAICYYKKVTGHEIFPACIIYQATNTMKFIADAMLGRLAKWLRLLGFDVLYYPTIDDRQVIKISREQGRTILTRDTRMLQCKAVRDAVFIRSDHIADQLLEMKNILASHGPDLEERCAVCNNRLGAVADRDEIKDLVPDYVYHNFNSFMRCSNCGKIYWEGSHYKKIRGRAGEILRENHED